MQDRYQSGLSSQVTEEKNIFIMSSCAYTAMGINELCASYAGWRLCGVARSVAELKKYMNRHPANMLIIEAGYASIDICTLRRLSEQLEGRIILLMDENTVSLQEVYRIAGINIAVTKSLPLSVLLSLMHWMMYAPQETLRPQRFHPRFH